MLRAVMLCFGTLTALCGPAAAQSLGLREVVRGSLEAGDRVSPDGRFYDCLQLRLRRSEWVAIQLGSGEVDVRVEAGPGRSCEASGPMVSDDDGAGYPNARLVVRPGRRTHVIRVSSYGAGETGDYHLVVVPSDPPPADRPNPFRSGTAERSLPFDWYDWVRPQEVSARYRWDAMCVAVNWVAIQKRVADPATPPGQQEEETALLAAALSDSARDAGHTEEDAEEGWKAWTAVAMSFSHDRMMVPHPLTLPLQRACVKQLRAGGAAAPLPPSTVDQGAVRR